MSLVLQDLCVHHGARLIARARIEVPPGRVVSVMGPSGSGKSSLLAAVIGMVPPGLRATGRVWLDGRDITGLAPHRRRLGILFQDDLLFPHLSVAGNLGFALPRGVPDRAGRIAAALADAGLAGFGPRDPATLSGGQRARVALLRVLVSQPRALLLDEPFAALDAGNRAQMRALVFDQVARHGLPTLLVTHDPEDAAAAGGPVIGPCDPA